MITKTKTKINSIVKQEDFIASYTYQTMDYDKFNLIAGNRPINRHHVAEIELSIKRYGYMPDQRILITLDNCIIDGQHRFTACKNLGIPILFSTINKNSYEPDLLDFIRALQNTQRRWTLIDAMDSFVLQNNPHYAKIKMWHEKYRISYSVISACFPGNSQDKTVNGIRTSISRSNRLHSGQFEIKNEQDEQRFIRFAETLTLIRNLKDVTLGKQNWINQDSFNYALWVFTNNAFVLPSTFHTKLQNHYHKITKQKDRRTYVEMFLHIYNFQNKQKISIKGYGEFLK